MNRNYRGRFTPNLPRLALAVALLGAFLLNFTPLPLVSAGSMCTLACCAGSAPHAAGSCMGKSCHAPLHFKGHHGFSRVANASNERFCGSVRNIKIKTLVAVDSGELSAQHDHFTALRMAIEQQCSLDCASCLVAFSNANQKKNPATMPEPIRICSPALARRFRLDQVRVGLSETSSGNCSPRGPPPLSS